MSKRRLILRPGGIGDCILALPALEHLAESADYVEIWVPTALVPLIHIGQRVRALADTGISMIGVGDLEPDPNLMAHLESFDHIVSWYGSNRPEFRALVPADFHHALPPAGCRCHASDFFSGQVGAPLGTFPRIRLKSGESRTALVVHPFSGGKSKNWPLKCFREVAARWPGNVQWCAGPEEELDEAHRFENLRELGGWLAGAAVYLGNDSGITHLAAALGVPTLAIFLATDPDVWALRGANVSVLRNPSVDLVSQQLERLWLASSERSACERR